MVSESFMVKAAAKSDRPMKHAAFIFKGGAFYAYANNTSTGHAEANVLRRIEKNKRKTVLVSLRVSASGRLLNARPCPDCWLLIDQWGIKTVFYSDNNGEIVKEKL